MKSRQGKIRQLARKNRMRIAAPSFLNNLSKALGVPIDLPSIISTSETDAITKIFRDGYSCSKNKDEPSYRRLFLTHERHLVFKLADCIADRLEGKAFLLSKTNGDPIAIEFNAATLLKHAASVIRIDGDSVCILSKDYTQGVFIDHNPDDPLETYEVAIWGNRWSLSALSCT